MANIDRYPEKYPTSIRAYARIKFKEPIPKEVGRVWTWESFCISLDGEDINIDFDDKEICIDRNDRTIVEVMWKNPDWDTFSEEFDKLTYEALKSEKIRLNDDLNSVVCASRTPDEDDVIDIDEILDMRLSSPYDEFDDVILK